MLLWRVVQPLLPQQRTGIYAQSVFVTLWCRMSLWFVSLVVLPIYIHIQYICMCVYVLCRYH
jgi:hypothetical protein